MRLSELRPMANPPKSGSVRHIMNATRTVLLVFTLGLAMSVLTSCTTTGANSLGSTVITDAPVPGSNNLQVVMTIPPSWHPLLEDRIDDAFVSHIADIFEQEGYRGNVVDVRLPDEPNPAYPLLTINLIDWRMNVTGDVECDFGAAVQTQTATRQLGLFSGLAMRWMELPGRFGLADTYGEAADDALRRLYRSIAQTQLVPGFVVR